LTGPPTDHQMTVMGMDLDRMKRTPWWAKPLIWWGRWRKDRLDKLAAEMRRAEHERWLDEPKYRISLIGRTYGKNGDDSMLYISHRWDLYETPRGARSLKFIAMQKSSTTSSHTMHARYIKPWLEGVYDMDYETTRDRHLRGDYRIWGNWKKVNVN
jgi:hypothetical protein